MTHLFLAAASSRCDPLAVKMRVKNTRRTSSVYELQDLSSSGPAGLRVCWHSDALWTLFCWAGGWEAGVNNANGGCVVTEEPWLNMDRLPPVVSQSQRNATADYPPLPPVVKPPSPPPRHTDSYDALQWVAALTHLLQVHSGRTAACLLVGSVFLTALAPLLDSNS